MDSSSHLTDDESELPPHTPPPTLPLPLHEQDGMCSPTSSQADFQTSKLLFAASRGDFRKVGRILSAGHNVNCADYDRRTALHIATANGSVEVVRLLLNSRADIFFKDNFGNAALSNCPNSEVRELLLQAAEQQANSLSRTKLAEQSDSEEEPEAELDVFRHLATAARNGQVHILSSLVKAGASINATDQDGQSSLHSAASHGQLEAVIWLLSHRADPSLPDRKGVTPLAVATMYGHAEIAKRLAETGLAHSASASTSTLSDEWIIQRNEIELGEPIGQTLKSQLFKAAWRGTKVVAKFVLKGKGMAEASHGESTLGRISEEFINEIQILAKIRHPDLVLFLGANFGDQVEHNVFFLTEYMEGGDLDAYFRTKSKKLAAGLYKAPIAKMLKWSSAIARGLCFLHNCRRPIIHRDLKPMNLLLTVHEDLKITDFGISKLMSPKVSSDSTPSPHMSGGVGSYRYMAPEVVRYEQYTDRVDIFSFALIMFFMASGLPPFTAEFGGDPTKVLKAYCAKQEPRPHMDSSVANSSFRQLMQDAWHVVPSERPSAADCNRRLEQMQSSSSSILGRIRSLLPG